MNYCRYNITKELTKVTGGKKAEEDIGLLLYFALSHYPATQKRIAEAFAITED